MEGKLWDTQEAVSQTHLFGFGEAFNYTFMFPWLLSWMRKGWLNISMLQKKKPITMKNPLELSSLLFTFERHV